MHVTAATNLACPIDASPLSTDGAVLRCAAGHSFDRAREGYCNLLVVQHKASRDPGDSKEMVAARRRFLEAGHYAPIAGNVFETVRACTAVAPPSRTYHILDAGCGEGYYLDRIGKFAASCPQPTAISFAGIDVSKWAVKAAARKPTPAAWLVANNRHPPFLPGSVELILCLFGFPVWEGFWPIQPVGGHVVLVDPGPDHLIELREIIYPTVTRSESTPQAAAQAAGYALQREQILRFQLTLDSQRAIQDLLAMTPHAHRLSQAGREALARRSALTVTADVVLRLLARK